MVGWLVGGGILKRGRRHRRSSQTLESLVVSSTVGFHRAELSRAIDHNKVDLTIIIANSQLKEINASSSSFYIVFEASILQYYL